MVIAWLLVGSLVMTAANVDDDATDVFPSALAKGKYPWYDAANDQARPLTPPPPPKPPTIRQGWGNFSFTLTDLLSLLVFLVLAAALVALFIYAARRWQSFLEGLDPNPKRKAPPATTKRVAALPTGLTVETDDPWAEARARRARGDLSGAIVCVFVHLLLRLDTRGLVRLAPGKTGRQLVRAIGRDEVRRMVEPTLRLFEAAYYGQRAPTPEAFDLAWKEAEVLDGQLAGEGPR